MPATALTILVMINNRDDQTLVLLVKGSEKGKEQNKPPNYSGVLPESLLTKMEASFNKRLARTSHFERNNTFE